MSERLEKIAASKLLAKEYQSYSATELSRLAQNNRPRYLELRQGMVDTGKLSPKSGYQTPGLRINHRVETPTEPLSDQEFSLMLKYPKAEIAKFYVTNGDKRNPDFTHILAKKVSDSPDAVDGFVPRPAAEQLEIRNAAILHGIIQGTVRFPEPEVKPTVVDDERVNAGELGKLAGLPPDARVTPKQYNDLLAADARRLAARSPSEVAQDRITALRLEADRVQASLDKAKESK